MFLFSNAAEGLHGWIGCDSCVSPNRCGGAILGLLFLSAIERSMLVTGTEMSSPRGSDFSC